MSDNGSALTKACTVSGRYIVSLLNGSVLEFERAKLIDRSTVRLFPKEDVEGMKLINGCDVTLSAIVFSAEVK